MIEPVVEERVEPPRVTDQLVPTDNPDSEKLTEYVGCMEPVVIVERVPELKLAT
jgi:hypothetical protein